MTAWLTRFIPQATSVRFKSRAWRRSGRRRLEALEDRTVLATFIINSTGDASDKATSDNRCDTGKMIGSLPECTLRAAIQQANSNGNPADLDNVVFALPSGGPHIIRPQGSPLDSISQRIFIDGYSQPGALRNSQTDGDNARLKIVLDGLAAGPDAHGLHLAAGSSLIAGLVISGFSRDGIRIEGGESNLITGNFIGTNSNGDSVHSNSQDGIAIVNSRLNHIGGILPGDRNIISGNQFAGVRIQGKSSNTNNVIGNFIGTDFSGELPLGNARAGSQQEGCTAGVTIQDAPLNFIGGALSGEGNLVSGNEECGIAIFGSDAKENVVFGNFIGTDVTGQTSVPNKEDGVLITSPVGSEGSVATGNEIGGVQKGWGNVISGNSGDGVVINLGSSGNKVRGNFIGVTVGSTDDTIGAPLGNGGDGVVILGSSNNVIGGGDADDGAVDGVVRARNIISANKNGVVIGVSKTGGAASNNRILGNFIGTDVSGSFSGAPVVDPFGNRGEGVLIRDVGANFVGGANAGEGNLISGNGDAGVMITGDAARNNEVLGNFIGTDADGNARVPNLLGVQIVQGKDNLIGRPIVGTAGAPAIRIGDAGIGGRNVIAGNRGAGVQIIGGNASGNQLRNNFIGIASNSTSELGNHGHGVHILALNGELNGPAENAVGGINDNDGNVVAFNGKAVPVTLARGHGVIVESGIHNSILQNRIFENYGLGIDLVDSTNQGFTPNDSDDSDIGANNLQNFPVFDAAVSTSNVTTIKGTLVGVPLITPYRIEFFSNTKSNVMQIGQGEKYLGFEVVTSNALGVAEFVKAFESAERNITATATNLLTLDTSEFSTFSVIQSVEFTQAIQILEPLAALKNNLKDDGSPPIPIVAKKPAVLRIYPNQVSQATQLDFHVTVPTSNGNATFTKHLVLGSTCEPNDRRRATGGCLSADIEFIPPVGEWTASVSVSDTSGNELESHEFTLKSKESDALVLKEVSVCETFAPTLGQWLCVPAGTLTPPLTDFLQAVAPTDEVRVVPTGHQVKLNVYTADMNNDGDINDCLSVAAPIPGCEADRWWHVIAAEVQKLFTLEEPVGGVPGEQRYYWGMVDSFLAPLSGIGGVSSSIPGRGGASMTSVRRLGVEANQETIAHELGHLMGRRHTNIAGPQTVSPPGCYSHARDSKTDWPYLTNNIQSGATVAPVPEVGFDVANKRVVLPESTFDMMSYCLPRWVSPHTYLSMLKVLDPPPPDPVGEKGEFWLVAGELQESGAARFDPLYRLETMGYLTAREGTHRLEVRNAAGAVLFTRFFTASSGETESIGSDNPGTPHFSQLIPVQPNAARIVLLDENGVEVGSLLVSGDRPVVTIEFPTGGETLDGIHEIRWSVSDADSTSHTYWAQYSADNGVTWQSLGTSLTEPVLKLDFRSLPGSNGNSRIRIFASDGVNSGVAVSAPFSVAKKLPTAAITSPREGAELDLNDLVLLRASAFDADDLFLEDSAYQWRSNLDGLLGNGDDLPLTGLSLGAHVITLSVTDRDGNMASDSISINVVDTQKLEPGAEPAVVNFANPVVEIDETVGIATITVNRIGDVNGRVTVEFATEDGAAKAGRDYLSVSGTLRFEAGETTKTFEVPILDDGLAEQPETVRLILRGPQGAAELGASSAIDLRILDDEAAHATIFLVTTTEDSGPGSLRQAILDANIKPGADFIHFNIPGPDIHTITPVLPFPKLTDPVSIDGYSQPGSDPNTLTQGNDAQLRIELDGTRVSGNGLELTGGGSAVRGLVINRFSEFGVALVGQGGSEIEGNFIGTDATGAIGLGNGPSGGGLGGGVRLLDSTNNRVGGGAPESRNLISANRGAGVHIEVSDITLALSGCGTTAQPLTTCNQVQGNTIGTSADGIAPLGNRIGVSIVGANDNLIGGADRSQGNVIAFSLENGVEVREQSQFIPGSLFQDQTQFSGGRHNAIRGNAIFSNSRFYASVSPVQFRKNSAGIDLIDRDDLNRLSRPIAVNDPNDSDTGPNDLQNYPVLESAVSTGGHVTIGGRLDSTPGTEFSIDLFASVGMDPSGFGEGELYLGTTAVRTDGAGHAQFAVTFLADVPDGRFITATATDLSNNTSEFSARIEVGDILNSNIFTVNSTNDVDDGICNVTHCSLREALHSSNNHPGRDTIRFGIPGGGVRTISPLLDLPPAFDSVVIDGYSQPGARPNSLDVGSDAILLIQLSGFNSGQGSQVLSTGLNLAGGESTVRGMVFNRLADGPLDDTHGIGLFVQRRGGNRIEGNFIGTDTSGSSVPPDPTGSNIPTFLTIASSDNTVGGTTPAARNVLRGVEIVALNRAPSDPHTFLTSADQNSVQGNYIGTTAQGVGIPLGFSNGHAGVTISGSANVLGGNTPEARNVIAGNSTGVVIRGRENQVLGNHIGVAVDGVHFGNQLNGIVLAPGAINNVIGGIASGEGNLIRGHRRNGVLVQTDSTATPIQPRGNAIRGNSILDNGLGQEIAETGLGIDLAGSDWLADDLETVNDVADRDEGPNSLQNFPVLHSAITANGAITIAGSLVSQPRLTFQIFPPYGGISLSE